jgi:hypothetical protein
MTQHECDYCEEVFGSETDLSVHKLVNHAEEIYATDDGTELVSSEHEPTENRYEKGEAFGYE